MKEAIHEVVKYAEIVLCKRRALLLHFGEPLQIDGAIAMSCGNCSSCLDPKLPVVTADYTEDARLILRTIANRGSGREKTVLILRGSNSATLKPDDKECSTYGEGKQKKKEYWTQLHKNLMPEYVRIQNPGELYTKYQVTPEGWKVIRDEAKSLLPKM